MLKAVKVSALILVLACSVSAGEIPNGVTSAGEIPNNATVAGEIPNDVTATTGATNSLTQVALTVLESALSMF